MTTAQRDSKTLSGELKDGDRIHNIDLGEKQFRKEGAWVTEAYLAKTFSDYLTAVRAEEPNAEHSNHMITATALMVNDLSQQIHELKQSNDVPEECIMLETTMSALGDLDKALDKLRAEVQELKEENKELKEKMENLIDTLDGLLPLKANLQ